MHRFILNATFIFCLLSGGLAYPSPFDRPEMQWIDAHPVVRFSIHEKYAPYLNSSSQHTQGGVFHRLLLQLGATTGQQFVPKWRKSDHEGFKQLANGEVDFMIDPPEITDQVLQFGSLSESIVWGFDAIVTTKNAKPIDASKVSFFERGLENPPVPTAKQGKISGSLEQAFKALAAKEIDALVMPIRLAHHLINSLGDSDIKVDGLYSREPFAYRWLVSHEDTPLNNILERFLSDLDPIESRELFRLNDMEMAPQKPYLQQTALPWITSLLLFILGCSIAWHLQRKYWQQKQQTLEMISSKEIAEKANAAKSAFLATMSHEIRTPMNAILGVQELLLNSAQFPKEERPLLKSAHASAESLLGMLNQVLDLSKIEAGKLTLNLEPCSLALLIENLHSAFSTVADKQNLILHTSTDPRIAEVLMMDSLRLRQVLQNLLSNAIKFTDQGEIYFSIVVLADDHAGQLIEFRVIDTGIGMGSEQIELALQAFEQVPSQTEWNISDQQKGTGLGLTITNHLVESMSSHLYFESAPGFGSNVHFSIAFPRTSIAAAHSLGGDLFEPPLRKCLRKRGNGGERIIDALVVEDHPASRQILSLQLEALGVQTCICENAISALHLLKERRFDLMLTDQSMPGMQGSELSKQLRSEGNRDLIIIGVTADIYALDARHQFLSAGMNGVLIKPLSLQTLENELARYFLVSDVGPKEGVDDYSFDVFSNLLRDDPKQICIILDEIQKVHDDVLLELNTLCKQPAVDEGQFKSLVHKVKGGAQLINAQSFIAACQNLERDGDLKDRINEFITLLIAENLKIAQYQKKYST